MKDRDFEIGKEPPRRLAILLPLLTLLLGLTITSSAQTPTADGNFHIALAGDSTIVRRMSVYDDPAYLQLIKRIRDADVAFTNFEDLVHNYESPGAASGGGFAPPSPGTYMQADPFVLDELKWAGFRLFSLANNHAYDYEAEGLLTSMRHFEQAGMIYAGVGENLARSRAPGYFETRKGRVALIACASSYPLHGPAGEQRGDVKGRPGASPLRVKTIYTVDAATLAGLRQAGGRGGRGGQGDMNFLGATFRAGDKPGMTTEADPKDVAGILAGVREARRTADWVIVSIHAHQQAGNIETPADFLRPFAHAAIDAGADVFVGHGPHVLRGIEIYKGKPIFYSLGNFIMQDDLIKLQPQEAYDNFKLGPSATPADFFDARWEANSFGFKGNKRYWQSVIAEPIFNSKRELQTINLYPIALTYSETNSTERGQPWPANAEDARAIVDRLASLSKPMETNIVFQDGKGVVKIGSPAK
jgi:poly-gamma-glutamate synthesis protein (capsule biosynthesis protein)